jgi:hypothetical protein
MTVTAMRSRAILKLRCRECVPRLMMRLPLVSYSR